MSSKLNAGKRELWSRFFTTAAGENLLAAHNLVSHLSADRQRSVSTILHNDDDLFLFVQTFQLFECRLFVFCWCALRALRVKPKRRSKPYHFSHGHIESRTPSTQTFDAKSNRQKRERRKFEKSWQRLFYWRWRRHDRAVSVPVF